MKSRFLALSAFAIFLISITAAKSAQAQSEAEIRNKVNSGVVTLITGGIEYASNTYGKLAGDLAAVLDKENELRVLPVLGYGATKNIRDILYLKGIDLGMVHSDVLKHLELTGKMTAATRRLRYITKLYDEPFHVIAHQSINSLTDLNGHKVATGPKDSGNDTSAQTMLKLVGITADVVNMPTDEAIELVRKGEIAAVIYTTRAPSKSIQALKSDDTLHLLAVPTNSEANKIYDTRQLSHDDYPDLIPEGKTVETLQMQAALITFNWPEGGARYPQVLRFVERFFENFDKLQEPGHHPVWAQLDPADEVKGWKRYAPAEKLLQKRQAARVQASLRGTAEPDIKSAGKSAEFQRFVSFMRKEVGKSNLSNQDLLDMYVNYKLWQQKALPSPSARNQQ